MSEWFPIMGLSYEHRKEIEKLREAGVPFAVVAIPWAMLAPHEAQAQKNHGQSLKRLAERGGLAPTEALDIIAGRPWGGLSFSFVASHRQLHDKIVEWQSKQIV